METGIFLCVIPQQPQHTTIVRTSKVTVCFSVTHECDWSERVNVRRSEKGEREGKQLWAEPGASKEKYKDKSFEIFSVDFSIETSKNASMFWQMVLKPCSCKMAAERVSRARKVNNPIYIDTPKRCACCRLCSCPLGRKLTCYEDELNSLVLKLPSQQKR